ncbi:MAG: YhfC family intramembrane metalloprotease [Chloroflexota bacterium]|nr:MAG: YhfC family intramembrane metalloprotease [Chloroflexota bacterium]
MNLWLYVLVTIIIILLPTSLAIWLRRGRRVPWLYFIVGILTFLGAQLVHLPLNRLLEQIGLLPQDTESGSIILTALILGLTAGVTEELARTAGYAIVRKARRYEDGLMMGLGHGGIEAMIVGVILAASVSSLWFVQEGGIPPIELSPEQSAALERQSSILSESPALALLPLVERAIALVIQVSLSIMVLMAFVRRNWLYVVAAIGVHTAFDFTVVTASSRVENIWLVEGLLALAAAPVAYWAWRQRQRVAAEPMRQRASLRRGASLFGAALGKEMLYQWRTKRLLIVCAVFLIFGMISPLLAEFTPQLLGSLEGAEQFADLIPEPSVGDAVGQYQRNITQFGFILAILLGMGAVAGEKEKGTAAMILSKPMPRWAFLTSKFVAQVLVYALAFVLAGAAAYFYTAVLFESLDAMGFFLANLILLAWLLVFVAVTLLGSALGKSIPAAAGWSALGAVILLTAGSLPTYGALAPSGLVAWAGQLALGAEGGPNGGSLAMSLVLILVLVISSMAVFEQQEV